MSSPFFFPLKYTYLFFGLVLFAACSTMPTLSKSTDKLPAPVTWQQAKGSILDTIVQLVQARSVYANNANWPVTIAAMDSIYGIYQDDSIQRIGKAAEYLFEAMNDHHGFLMYNYQLGFSNPTKAPTSPERAIENAVFNAMTGKINKPYRIHSHYFEAEQVAYLEVLGTGMMHNEEIPLAIRNIQETICAFAEQGVARWIIDIRCNTGGNSNVTLNGLAPLFDNRALGGDSKDLQTPYSDWRFEDNRFYMGQSTVLEEPATACPLPTSKRQAYKIAVLTSRYTASAGEVIASSLYGQSNTQLFGEATAGMSQTNGWHILGDGWILVPPEAYYRSINGEVHKKGVPVDVVVPEPIDLDNLLSGAVIETALAWLAS